MLRRPDQESGTRPPAARPHSIRGFSVHIPERDRMRDKAALESTLAKVDDAINDIRRFDPTRYARMLDLCTCIIVLPVRSAMYWEETNVCVLSMDVILEYSPGLTACDIVHEFTHAKLARAGFLAAFRRDLLSRMERLCTEEEIAFLRKTPDELYATKQKYIASLRESLSEAWWTTENRQTNNRLWQEWRRQRGYPVR